MSNEQRKWKPFTWNEKKHYIVSIVSFPALINMRSLVVFMSDWIKNGKQIPQGSRNKSWKLLKLFQHKMYILCKGLLFFLKFILAWQICLIGKFIGRNGTQDFIKLVFYRQTGLKFCYFCTILQWFSRKRIKFKSFSVNFQNISYHWVKILSFNNPTIQIRTSDFLLKIWHQT